MTPDFSVVILHYNAPVFLEGALDSVVRAVQERNAEIIVADNASPDFDVDYFRQRFPQVKFIVHPENYGFARGNNLAVQAARGRWLFLVNPDVIVPENLFRELLPRLEQLHNPGVCSIRLLDGQGNYLPESKRRKPSLTGFAGHLFLGRSGRYYDERLKPEQDGPSDVFVGAFMAMLREEYLNTGGFDERFFMYGEDIDLSVRFLQKGLTNYYFGSLAAIHFKGESSPRNATYRQRFARATSLYLEKHYPLFYRLSAPLTNLTFKTWTKRNKQPAPAPRQITLPVGYIGHRDSILGKLDNHFGKKPAVFSPEHLPTEPHFLVLDPASYEFQTLINLLQNNQTGTHRFRWLTLSGNYIYGSDLPDALGESIRLQQLA